MESLPIETIIHILSFKEDMDGILELFSSSKYMLKLSKNRRILKHLAMHFHLPRDKSLKTLTDYHSMGRIAIFEIALTSGNKRLIDYYSNICSISDICDAIQYGCTNVVKYYLKSKEDISDEIVYIAIHSKNVDLLTYLLRDLRFEMQKQHIYEVITSLYTYESSTELFDSIYNGFSSMYKDIRYSVVCDMNHIDAIRDLINRDNTGISTIRNYAIKKGYISILKFLVEEKHIVIGNAEIERAIIIKNYNIIPDLLSMYDGDITGKNIYKIIAHCPHETVDILFNRKLSDKSLQDSVIFALEYGDEYAITVLKERGLKIPKNYKTIESPTNYSEILNVWA